MSDAETTPPMMLTDKQYTVLKWIVGIVIPAIGTLYFAVAKIWSLPAGEQVLGTLIAIQAFLGAVLGVSTKKYNDSDAKYDGKIVKTETDEKTTATLEFKDHPQEALKKSEVLMKVE